MDNKRLSKREANKQIKELKLLEAAYELFVEQGIQNTSVNDIVKKAGIAKGTFYLYFKDKTDIEEQLIVKETKKILEAAIKYAGRSETSLFEDQFLVAVDYIIDYLEINTEIMSFITKNLSYALYNDGESNNKLLGMYNKLYMEYKDKVGPMGLTEPDMVISLCIEFLGASIYSSLSLNMPKPMVELRPHLHKMIRTIFKAYTK